MFIFVGDIKTTKGVALLFY